METKDAARMVSAEVLGMNIRTVVVNDKAYVIYPPTIARLMGSTYYLTDLPDASSIRDVLKLFGKMESLCKALSHFIAGDESLSEELMSGTMDEIIAGLEMAYDLIDVGNFTRLSTLVRSARMLTAKQK